MIPARNLLASLMVLLFLGSCQEELEDFDPPVSNTPDSNYLYKVYNKDSSAAGVSTIEVFTYEYDATGRVKVYTDSLSGNIVRYYQYYYQGNDTLPYRSLLYDYSVFGPANPTAIDTFNTFFVYDASGRKVYDSVIAKFIISLTPPNVFDTVTRVSTYQYAGNFIYGDNIHRTTAGNISYHYRDTAQTDGNGNIVSSKHYDHLSGSSMPERSYTVTYDNNPCSFGRASNFRTFPVFPQGYLTEHQSKNNRLKITETSSGPPVVDDFTGNYLYNNRSYPVRKFQPGANPGEYYTYDFYYKAF